MQMITAHITWQTIPGSKYIASSANLDVPGIGQIEIKDFITNELRSRIEAEAIFCLRQKLGIKTETKEEKKEEPKTAVEALESCLKSCSTCIFTNSNAECGTCRSDTRSNWKPQTKQ